MSKEAEMRLARIKKERSDFERRIQSKAINELSAMETKKVLQSIFGNTKSSQLVKLVGYNQVLKDKRRKLLMQLQRPDKEDHFQDQREENVDRNSDELQIKYSKIQHNLNSHKDKLQSVLHQSAELSHVIAKKEKQLRKVEDDLKSAEEVCERQKEEDLVKLLSRQVNESLPLDVTHYIQVKEKKRSLLNSIRAWERKVRVAEETRKELKYTERAALDLDG
ncbi:coiled-coil domain-containing protein 113-like [Synchiropus splendidus]|uniref:coiled-coil domain-containing protein 113-like n=1 Tax=Synchiropus splendidus TaxID=270530 RepID=UPI00237D9574|nr:coiled-coil domain-containing protein 113-like [Synchiropus splendidus]